MPIADGGRNYEEPAAAAAGGRTANHSSAATHLLCLHTHQIYPFNVKKDKDTCLAALSVTVILSYSDKFAKQKETKT